MQGCCRNGNSALPPGVKLPALRGGASEKEEENKMEQVLMHSKQDQAKLAVDAVVHLIRDVGLPVTLREYGGIEEKDLKKMADRMIELWHRPMNPRPMGGKESIKFWRDMWKGI
jgi:alcohol dehydrogenase class IV